MLADRRPRVHRPLIVELSSSETPDDEDSPGQHEQEEQDATQATQRGRPELPDSHSVGQTRAAVHTALAAQHAVPTPPASVFADVCASPNGAGVAADAQQYCSAVAATLRELATRLTALTLADMDFGADPAASAVVHSGGWSPTAAHPSDTERRGLRPGVLIEEVTNDAPSAPAPQRLSAAELVLLCGMHAQDDALAGAWVTADTSAAARAALECLASKQTRTMARHGEASAHVKQHRGASAGTHAAAGHGEVPAPVQQLIVRTLPAVLRLLRPVLGKPREPRLQGQRAAYMPPLSFGEEASPFDRLLAARQLAWLVRRLQGGNLGSSLLHLLPAVLAAVDDPSPAVQCQALAGLQHIAESASASDLRGSRDLLADTAKRVITGADERVWPAAAPAACALMTAVEVGYCTAGPDSWAAGYDALMKALLGEAQLHQQLHQRTVVWLTTIRPLIQTLGLVTMRYFGRMMPLLLGWIQSPDITVQTEALRTLAVVMQATWPRMPAHATQLWRHLDAAYRTANLPAAPGATPKAPATTDWPQHAQAESFRDTGRLLFWCGTDALRDSLKADCTTSAFAQAVLAGV